MKIVACVTVGDDQVIQEWELGDDHLIIALFDDCKLVVPIDKSKILHGMSREEFERQLLATFCGPSRTAQPEHLEALNELIKERKDAYLGTLDFAQAKLMPLKKPN